MCEARRFQFPILNGNAMEIDINDILYFESQESLSLAYYRTTDSNNINQKYINSNLGIIESQLSAFGFYRSHRTCLINLATVQPYGKYPDVLLDLGHEIMVPLSRRRRLEFHKVYLAYQRKATIK